MLSNSLDQTFIFYIFQVVQFNEREQSEMTSDINLFLQISQFLLLFFPSEISFM